VRWGGGPLLFGGEGRQHHGLPVLLAIDQAPQFAADARDRVVEFYFGHDEAGGSRAVADEEE